MNSLKASSAAVLAVSLLCSAGAARAKHLGQVGKVYEIAEPDALEEIQAKAAGIDWDKALGGEKKKELIEGYRPENLAKLPRAEKNRTRLIDMTYELDADLPDGKGGSLYPKGFRFNPLEYFSYPNILVFIDGDDQDQVEWFQESKLSRDDRTRLILTGGAFAELNRKLERPVYYLTEPIKNRLRLEAAPSIIWQKGLAMEVKEIHIAKKQ